MSSILDCHELDLFNIQLAHNADELVDAAENLDRDENVLCAHHQLATAASFRGMNA